MSNTHPDNIYLKALRENDSAKVKEIYAKCFPKVDTYIRRNGGSTQDAADVFHDVLVDICKRLRNGEELILTATICNYIGGACRNKWLQILRDDKYSRNKIRFEDDWEHKDDSANTDDEIIRKETEDEINQKIEQAFNKLGDRCKKLLQLFRSGYDADEIKDILEYRSRDVVYVQKSRCSRKWRSLYDELK